MKDGVELVKTKTSNGIGIVFNPLAAAIFSFDDKYLSSAITEAAGTPTVTPPLGCALEYPWRVVARKICSLDS